MPCSLVPHRTRPEIPVSGSLLHPTRLPYNVADSPGSLCLPAHARHRSNSSLLGGHIYDDQAREPSKASAARFCCHDHTLYFAGGRLQGQQRTGRPADHYAARRRTGDGSTICASGNYSARWRNGDGSTRLSAGRPTRAGPSRCLDWRQNQRAGRRRQYVRAGISRRLRRCGDQS